MDFKYFAKFILLSVFYFGSCSQPPEPLKTEPLPVKKDTFAVDSVALNLKKPPVIQVNDTLNQIAAIIAGKCDSSFLFSDVMLNKDYKKYRSDFSKRWKNFDSTRITQLVQFHDSELVKEVKTETTLFYPFSGPDFLYANLFFPEAQRYILLGLEPVGTLPEFKSKNKDSLANYFNKLNKSLNTLLKFSFFRTNSMETDLKNNDLDGVIHLIFLFLNRDGDQIVSAKPIGIDSTGNRFFYSSFEEMKMLKPKISGVKVTFLSPDKKKKELIYFSYNVSDPGLRKNNNFKMYLERLEHFNTYLKGASYLMHKPYFSILRNIVLDGSTSVIQDDSGIAFRYFRESGSPWKYTLYGNYTKPISLFSKAFQPDLDSLYKVEGSKKIGFGIGYNFKDKNSNLMVATHP